MADGKAYVQDVRNEHGQAIAREAKERADLKDSYKDDYVTHKMQISRDDITRLNIVITKHPNAGQFKKIVEFLLGDKGFWTKELTLEILDHDEELDDYVNEHESLGDQIAEAEAKLNKLKEIKEKRS